MSTEKTEHLTRNGLVSGLIAYTLWGFAPIYFKLTQAVPALEVLAHRVAWAVPFGLVIILWRRQLTEVGRALLKPRILALLSLAAAFIALNWGLYIWAVQNQQIFQASLGYYINPLIYVLVGVVAFGERLRSLQLGAVALATAGVLVLTFSGGQFPAIALTLAVSFTIYGVIRKQVVIGGMPGLFIETLIMLPLALAYLGWLSSQDQLVFGEGAGTKLNLLILLAGPVTVLPLLFFALAARRLSLSTLGFMQFIGPTLQFFLGIYYGEPLRPAALACFVLIWLGVLLFVADVWRQGRRTGAAPIT